jgi:hypothetical protein
MFGRADYMGIPASIFNGQTIRRPGFAMGWSRRRRNNKLADGLQKIGLLI